MSKGSGLGEAFEANYKDVSEDQADELIVESIKKIKEIRNEKKNDNKLNALKEQMKVLSSAYNEATKHENRKVNFFLEKKEEIVAISEARTKRTK